MGRISRNQISRLFLGWPHLGRALAVAILTAVAPMQALAQDADTQRVLIDDLLLDIRDSLIVINRATANDLALEKATLTLKTAFEIEASGKVNFWVIRLGSGVSRDAVQTLTINLAPPSPGDAVPVSSVSESLSAAVIAAYEATAAAAAYEPPLNMTNITATVHFSVETSASAGGGFKFSPISVDAGSSIAETEVQTITLTFAGAEP